MYDSKWNCHQMWHQRKVLNVLTDVYLTVAQQAFVEASRRLLCGESFPGVLGWDFGPNLQTNSLQNLKVLCGPFLWPLTFSSGYRSGDWLGETLHFFLWSQSIVSCLYIYSHFFAIRNVSAHFSFILKCSSVTCWTTQTLVVHTCWYGVYYACNEWNYGPIWPDYVLPVFQRLVWLFFSKI